MVSIVYKSWSQSGRVVPVAQGRCFCRTEGVFWSSDEETPHTLLPMQQTCLLTCSHWTASYGSEKGCSPFNLQQDVSLTANILRFDLNHPPDSPPEPVDGRMTHLGCGGPRGYGGAEPAHWLMGPSRNDRKFSA